MLNEIDEVREELRLVRRELARALDRASELERQLAAARDELAAYVEEHDETARVLARGKEHSDGGFNCYDTTAWAGMRARAGCGRGRGLTQEREPMSDIPFYKKVWQCRVGPAPVELPPGADWPMRKAVQDAFEKLFEVSPLACFSGWANEFTEIELAVIEDRDARKRLNEKVESEQAERPALATAAKEEPKP